MPSTGRKEALFAIANITSHPTLTYFPESSLFGKNVFNTKVMQERLPRDVFITLKKVIAGNDVLKDSDANIIANAMKDWAVEKNTTHYAHWFQPMSGLTAEKQDAFLTPTTEGKIISAFSGKMLVQGKPDASAFPSGGIRSTFEARGYTAWDPSSPAFIMESEAGNTLYIPTLFIAYTGEALDRKTPLIRSATAVSKQALRILHIMGKTEITDVKILLGAEQEFFLVDKRLAMLRDDLRLCGRTLYGSKPSKGQDLADHYFGAMPQRVQAYLQEVEQQLFSLGVPVRTRHNESAPGQFEIAPVHEPINIATDHNILIMNILQSTADRHSLTCLLHEKPFARISGSGKHNNWSLQDSSGKNLFEPGSSPHENTLFLLFLTAVIRAAHIHSILLRIGTIGTGNDLRLGGIDAPPAIISLYLGNELEKTILALIEGKEIDNSLDKPVELNINNLPLLLKDSSDRNRTSPLAFTGDKFEFRMQGSSQSPAIFNTAFNTAVACALDDIAYMLETLIQKQNKTPEEAARTMIPKVLAEHKDIIYNGNNYSLAWHAEASKRKLPYLRHSVDALAQYTHPTVINAFTRQNVLTEQEIFAQQDILLENYSQSIKIEAQTALYLGKTFIQPAAYKWQEQLGRLAIQAKNIIGSSSSNTQLIEETNYFELRSILVKLTTQLLLLEELLKKFNIMTHPYEKATFCREHIIPAMQESRIHADWLEDAIDDSLWPLPKYTELLWLR